MPLVYLHFWDCQGVGENMANVQNDEKKGRNLEEIICLGHHTGNVVLHVQTGAVLALKSMVVRKPLLPVKEGNVTLEFFAV